MPESGHFRPPWRHREKRPRGKGLSFAVEGLVLPAPSEAALAASRETASGKGLSFAVGGLGAARTLGGRFGGLSGNGFREGIVVFCRRLLGGGCIRRRRGMRRRVSGIGGRLWFWGRLFLWLGRGRREPTARCRSGRTPALALRRSLQTLAERRMRRRSKGLVTHRGYFKSRPSRFEPLCAQREFARLS